MAKQDDITELLDFEEEVEQALEKIDGLLRHVIFRIRERDGRVCRARHADMTPPLDGGQTVPAEKEPQEESTRP